MVTGTRFGGRGSKRTRSEWIGGQLTPPFFITDREEPYRPEMIVWMEASSGLVVGQELVEPENAAGAVVRVLRAAMEQPLAGPPRRPGTIRVRDAVQAAEIRATVGDAIPVRVAPTPELDQLLELMLESPLKDAYGVDSSYLEGGRVASSTVGELFAAGRLLYGLAPWKTAADNRLLRMDIPALNIDGACVSIIGQLGESHGVLIFPSLAGYEAFLEVAEKPPAQGRPHDFGTGWLALCFESGADLPPSMRREVESHGWSIAGTDAYPRVERREVDGASRPLVERDVKIATACANSLCALLVKHEKLFEADEFEPLCESYFDKHDLEVRFTLPYEAFRLFDIDEDPTPRLGPMAETDRVKVGRNDPCPCGSGRKYKKCHLRVDEQERSARLVGESHHDLDRRLVDELTSFAVTRFASEWYRFRRDFADSSEALQLSAHWSLYHYRVQGATVADWFLEERGRRLPAAESAWLVAQRASWLSVWEVIEVEPGTGIEVRDLLSHETRKIREKSASRMLIVRDALLGRVVGRDDVFLLCGVHPRPLPPLEAAEVVRRARGRLRRKRAVPVDRLRDEAFGRYLIRRWEEVVARYDARCAIPPELQNTDGDALLLTVDHFKIVPGARSAVAERLVALDDVELQDDDPDPSVYVFVRPGNAQPTSWESTLIGRAVLADRTLKLETNSQERADGLRLRVESACGDKIRHLAREHTDPLSSQLPGMHRAPQLNLPPAELEQLLLEHKQRHYADWIDHALPALDGKSPRETARTPSGRAAVDALLKDMENREHRAASGAAFDFAEIRRRLQLE